MHYELKVNEVIQINLRSYKWPIERGFWNISSSATKFSDFKHIVGTKIKKVEILVHLTFKAGEMEQIRWYPIIVY